MKTTSNHLPPNLQPFASLLDAQPPQVQEAFQFLLATAMHEAGKQARCSAWCGQELDCRSPYFDDEPVRLALSVDL